MARNGSGTYAVPNTFTPGTPISSADHNENFQDAGDEITNSVAADGQTTMTGPLKASSGSASAPSLTFGADTNTGLYRSASDEMSATTEGVQRLAISSAGLDIKTGELLFAGVAGLPADQLNINGAEELTAPAVADVLAISDADDSNEVKKITTANLFKVINGLTADGSPDGSADYVATWDNSASGPKKVLLNNLPAILPPGYLFGLTLSNNGSDATNDIDIATGKARDGDDTDNMILGSALTKQLDGAWSVGTNAGGLDTGSIANTTYHVWLIKRSDTGVVDVLFSTSASSPTMPADYDKKRRIGSIVRASGAIKAFSQDGDEFLWNAAVLDVDVSDQGATAVLRALTVPLGIKVKALLRARYSSSSAGQTVVTSPDESDQSPSATAAPIYSGVHNTTYETSSPLQIRTDTSGRVRTRSNVASTTVKIATYGYIDSRGRLA